MFRLLRGHVSVNESGSTHHNTGPQTGARTTAQYAGSGQTHRPTQATRQSTKPSTGTSGYHGARYCRSLEAALPGLHDGGDGTRSATRRCSSTPPPPQSRKSLTAPQTPYPAPTTLENSASTPPSMQTESAVSGTPFLLTRAKQARQRFLVRQRPQHPPGGVQARVRRREDRRQDHEVKDIRRVRDARPFQTPARTGFSPRPPAASGSAPPAQIRCR